MVVAQPDIVVSSDAPSTNTWPQPEVQKRQVQELELRESSMQIGQRYFAVEKKWFDEWLKFVDEGGPRPGKLDNTSITDAETDGLQENDCFENIHYVLKSIEVYELLKTWYGLTGSEIAGTVQENSKGQHFVDLLPIRFEVLIAGPLDKHYKKATTHHRWLVLSRSIKVGTLKQQVEDFCKTDILESGDKLETRIWIGSGSSSKLNLLEEIEDDSLGVALTGLGTWKLLLELKFGSGQWPYGINCNEVTLSQDELHTVVTSPKVQFRQRGASFVKDDPEIGQHLDVKRDLDGEWYEAVIVAIDQQEVKIHFLSFNEDQDQLVSVDDVNQVASPYTKVADWRTQIRKEEELDISRRALSDDSLKASWLIGRVKKFDRKNITPGSRARGFVLVEIKTGTYQKKEVWVNLDSEDIAQRYTHIPKPKVAYGAQGVEEKPEKRGIVGLRNLGNTCYMNSMIQCLSHTQPLTDCFISGDFESDINRKNPLGTGGKLAESFGGLLRDIWDDKFKVAVPSDFKSQLGRAFTQFQGYQQQDSHELFSLLIDGIHEDLNRVKQKPYTEPVESSNRPDGQVAVESWDVFRKRNDSVVVDAMMGLLKSHLTCPTCNEQATKFDAYSNWTVPIPKNKTKKINIVFRQKGDGGVPFLQRFIGTFSHSSSGSDVAAWLSQRTEIPVSEIVLFKSHNNHKSSELIFPEQHTSYTNTIFDVRSWDELDDVAACHVSEPPMQDDPLQENPVLMEFLFRNNESSSILLSDFIWIQPKISGRELHKLVWNQVQWMFVQGYSPPSGFLESMSDDDFMETDMPTAPYVVKAGKFNGSYMSSVPCDNAALNSDSKLVAVDFSEASFDSLILVRHPPKSDSRDDSYGIPSIIHDPSVAEMSKVSSKKGIEIYDCFEKFREQEQLGDGDEWYCPKCKNHVKAFKEMNIWSVPEVLVIHLKRFYYERSRYVRSWVDREKINDMVTFPLEGLDLSRFVDEGGHELLYDCYAVSNHIGGMGGGHYTAYVKYQKSDTEHKDDQWYCMDDSRSSPIDTNDVVSPQAYVLFYRRRHPERQVNDESL